MKRRVSVARVGSKLSAFDDLCPHEASPLSAGLLTGTTLKCQCHGSQFDITSGAVLHGPATKRLPPTRFVKRTRRSRFAPDRRT